MERCNEDGGKFNGELVELADRGTRPAGRPCGKTRKEREVADPVPAGSDVSAGTYKCTHCGYELQVGSTQHLPPCPSCGNGAYSTVAGGDAVADPYPDS